MSFLIFVILLIDIRAEILCVLFFLTKFDILIALFVMNAIFPYTIHLKFYICNIIPDT